MDIELVMTLLIRKHEDDQHANRHRRSQPRDIDKGKYLVLQEIPEPGLEIVEKHNSGLWVKK